jgi:hypothetical protein
MKLFYGPTDKVFTLESSTIEGIAGLTVSVQKISDFVWTIQGVRRLGRQQLLTWDEVNVLAADYAEAVMENRESKGLGGTTVRILSDDEKGMITLVIN